MARRFTLSECKLAQGVTFEAPQAEAWAVYVLSGLLGSDRPPIETGQAVCGAAPRGWKAEAQTRVLACTIGAAADPPGHILACHLVPDSGGDLLRCDTVRLGAATATPPHRHAGPGFRYLMEGSIAAQIGGRHFTVAPGEAWLERPEDLIVGRTQDRPARFVRFILLPAEYRGRSSFIAEPPGAPPPTFDVAYARLLDEPIASLQ